MLINPPEGVTIESWAGSILVDSFCRGKLDVVSRQENGGSTMTAEESRTVAVLAEKPSVAPDIARVLGARANRTRSDFICGIY
jgi:hypothetical protein